jgi:predicted NUDIX family NTP pyrophosphohydrolase
MIIICAMKQSAGLLLFKTDAAGLQFFLVHPGGPYFIHHDRGAWTVPKGEVMPGEEPVKTALREFEEETGKKVSGMLIPLQPVVQKGGKHVYCWAVQGDIDAEGVKSNLFSVQWPPRSGSIQQYPEIDRGAWFSMEEAQLKINERQIPFLKEVAGLR